MDGTHNGKRRREKEIRFISSADTTAGDAAAAALASAGRLHTVPEVTLANAEEAPGSTPAPGPVSAFSAALHQAKPTSLLATPTASSARERNKAAAALGAAAATANASARAAPRSLEVPASSLQSPTSFCRQVTDSDDIDFSNFTRDGRPRVTAASARGGATGLSTNNAGSHAHHEHPLSQGDASDYVKRPSYYTRQQQRELKRQQWRGQHGSASRKGYVKTSSGSGRRCREQASSGRAGQVGTNPFASARRTSLSSTSSFGSSAAGPTRANSPTQQLALSRGVPEGTSMNGSRAAERPVSAAVSTVFVYAAGGLHDGGVPTSPAPDARGTLSDTGVSALLPATALLLAAAEKEAERTHQGVLSGARQTSDAPASAPQGERGGSALAEGAAIASGENVKADGLGTTPSSTLRHLQPEQARDSFYVRKHMQNVAQAKQSQKQMREFEGVLKRMEEEALRVRRKARQRASPAPTTGSGSTPFAGGGGPQGDLTPDGVEDVDDSHGLEDDSYDYHTDEESEDGDAEESESAVGLLYLGSEVGATTQRYTPFVRRQQQMSGQQQQQGGQGGGPGRNLTAQQQQRVLRCQLVAAERFLREHPEMETALHTELVASEARLSAARTVRLHDAKSLATSTRSATMPGDLLNADSTGPDGEGVKENVAETFDWTGYAPTGIRRAVDDDDDEDREEQSSTHAGRTNSDLSTRNEEGSTSDSKDASGAVTVRGAETDAVDRLAEERPLPLSSIVNDRREATSVLVNESSSNRSGVLHADVSTRVGTEASTKRDSLVSLLSESLQHMSYEDTLAELLERGNGRSVYRTEGSRSAGRPTRPRRAHVPKVSPAGTSSESALLSPSRASNTSRTASPTKKALAEEELNTSVATVLQSVSSPATSPYKKEKSDRRVTFAASSPGEKASSAAVTPPGAGSAPKTMTGTTSLSNTAGKATAAGKAGSRRGDERGTNNAERKAHPFQLKRKKTREPLPVMVGVGDRAAAELRKELMLTRLTEMEAKMTAAKDTRRTCELLARLHPLREELVHRDILDMYNVTDPTEWERKYPRRSGSTVSLPLITQGQTRVSPLPNGAATSTAAEAAATTSTDAGALALMTPLNQPTSATAVPQRKFANANEVLERHRNQLFATAFELDDEHRQRARLLFIDVLEGMSEKQIPQSTWPAAQAALNHARDILLHEPRDHQSFIGFQAIVHKHFSLLQLIQWPVQQMLEHLAALFLLTPREYREWLANLYQKLSNCHDYEARFRAIDRGIKDKDIPDEAQVRIVLHSCRRLPRAFLMQRSNAAASSPKAAGGPDADRSALTGTLPPMTASHTLRVPAAVSLTSATPGSPLPAALASSSTFTSADATFRGLTSTVGALALPQGQSGSTSGDGGGGSASTTPVATTLMEPFSPSSTNSFARNITPVAAVPAETEYAVRIEAERQTITSSAVPASNGQGGRANPDGPRGGGRGGAMSGKEPGGAGKAGAANSRNGGGGGAAAAAGKNVNFFNQTFKLHLYDASSSIRMTLLRDGQPVAEGSFSVQRYGNGKRIQLWLPLTLTRAAVGTNGNGASVRPAKQTELKVTVELL